MENPSFVPKLPVKSDTMSHGLMTVARLLLIGAVGLVPLVFIPGVPMLLGATKVFFVLVLLLLALVAMSLSILRSGSVTLRMAPLLISWWAVAGSALLSTVLSPTPLWSFAGDVLEIHTAGFLVLLGVLMTALVSFGSAKKSIVYLFGALLGSTVVIVLLQAIRLVFGAGVLSLGILNGPAANLVGSFNDLGIYLGLVVLIGLVTVVQLSLSRMALIVAAAVMAISLLILALVNFFAIWLIISLFSLMLLMYSLTKDRFGVAAGMMPVQESKLSLATTGIVAVVFLVATVFLVGGSSIGAVLSQKTGINYLEIRPSIGATLDILRHTYHDNAFTGAGANRFGDMWQQYKDPVITQTIFWNTPFNAGSGYVPTWFITTGLFGVLAWLVFLGIFLYTGVMMLVKGQATDIFWYFTGTLAFVAGAFIWIISLLYVPGPTILIIGAASTGVMIAAYQALLPRKQSVINMLTTARTGFVLIVCVMLVIISTVLVGYGSVRQFIAAHTYVTAANNLPQDGTQIQVVVGRIMQAYTLYPSDTYARDMASYYLLDLNNLLSLTNATPAQRTEFQQAITAGIASANEAIQRKSTDAQNWRVLGDTYALLAAVNIEGASQRASDAYHEAEIRDPRNPYYVLQKSIIALRAKNYPEARRLALMSLDLKANYTDALFVLSQIDIATGDVTKAIASTESLIALESNNAGRYYQLGVLQIANKNRDAAIAAFTAAITLDPNYANARYLRALQYLSAGDKALAISELKVVRGLNPDNKAVDELIGKIEHGEVSADTLNQPAPITEPTPVTNNDAVTTSDTAPETDLLKSVNGTKPKGASASTTPVTVKPKTSTTTPVTAN
jgi:tetratricopeptide (TPR) repeat protein